MVVVVAVVVGVWWRGSDSTGTRARAAARATKPSHNNTTPPKPRAGNGRKQSTKVTCGGLKKLKNDSTGSSLVAGRASGLAPFLGFFFMSLTVTCIGYWGIGLLVVVVEFLGGCWIVWW